MDDHVPSSALVQSMHCPAFIAVKRAFRAFGCQKVEDGGAGAARRVIGFVALERVGDAELVAVCFDEVAAFGMGLEVQGIDDLLRFGGIAGVGEGRCEPGRQGGIAGGHCWDSIYYWAGSSGVVYRSGRFLRVPLDCYKIVEDSRDTLLGRLSGAG